MMPIKLRDIANAKVPRTEKEWAAAEREYRRECEEDRRYESAVEAYKVVVLGRACAVI